MIYIDIRVKGRGDAVAMRVAMQRLDIGTGVIDGFTSGGVRFEVSSPCLRKEGGVVVVGVRGPDTPPDTASAPVTAIWPGAGDDADRVRAAVRCLRRHIGDCRRRERAAATA